jgi:hypothetical protein
LVDSMRGVDFVIGRQRRLNVGNVHQTVWQMESSISIRIRERTQINADQRVDCIIDNSGIPFSQRRRWRLPSLPF